MEPFTDKNYKIVLPILHILNCISNNNDSTKL